jgi:hypothetical protein
MQHYISADSGKLAKTCRKLPKITKKIIKASKKSGATVQFDCFFGLIFERAASG